MRIQVMIYLIDRVLPESFFANNLRALFVDMAVFRDLMRSCLPHLSRHLDRLRATSPSDQNTGKCRPPRATLTGWVHVSSRKRINAFL